MIPFLIPLGAYRCRFLRTRAYSERSRIRLRSRSLCLFSHETGKTATGLQNLHPRFKSGRRLHYSFLFSTLRPADLGLVVLAHLRVIPLRLKTALGEMLKAQTFTRSSVDSV